MPKAQSIRSPHPQTRTQSKSTKPRRVLGTSVAAAPSTTHAVPTRGPPTHPQSRSCAQRPRPTTGNCARGT
eukprot:3570271-Pyramimonas_sp.AAC.1